MRQQERATKNVEVEREIPDLPEIPADVLARFPSMVEYQRKQFQIWHTVQLVFREFRDAMQKVETSTS